MNCKLKLDLLPARVTLRSAAPACAVADDPRVLAKIMITIPAVDHFVWVPPAMVSSNMIVMAFLLPAAIAQGWITWKTIACVLFLMVCFVVNLVMNQESVLYIPVIQGIKSPNQNPPGLKTPSDQGLDFEEVWLPVRGEDGLEIHGWFLPAASDPKSAPTILFCHENAGNIGLRLQEFKCVRQFCEVNQFVFDYRGYGASKGSQKPSEEGIFHDAKTALEYVQKLGVQGKLDASKIILCGRSLGGAVVCKLAAHLCEAAGSGDCGLLAVILENTFTCIEDMVDHMFPFFNVWPSLKKKLIRLKWRSVDYIHQIRVPLLMLSSDKDEIVPSKCMHQLRKAATGTTCEFHQFAEATHNDIWVKGGEGYWKAKAAFIDKVAGTPPKNALELLKHHQMLSSWDSANNKR